MTDGDALLARCCYLPHDRTAQLVFADWLAEHGETELEAAMRGEGRVCHMLCLTYLTSVALQSPLSLRLLWSVAFVLLPLEEKRKIVINPLRLLTPAADRDAGDFADRYLRACAPMLTPPHHFARVLSE